MTTATHLWTIAHHWRDLATALASTGTATWPPAGRMADYLASIHRSDDEAEAEQHRAAALRSLERSPEQIGEMRAPIRLHVLEIMQTVRADLLECADQTAAAVQRPVMSPLPKGYPDVDRARREILIMQDRRDPRRWKWAGIRPDAAYTALWLLARVQGAPGPFRPLHARELDHVASVARTACGRVERALDIVGQRRSLAERHECGGRIDVYGGAGAHPTAHCTGCGRTWTEQDAAAVA
jgi:hypothetical protein